MFISKKMNNLKSLLFSIIFFPSLCGAAGALMQLEVPSYGSLDRMNQGGGAKKAGLKPVINSQTNPSNNKDSAPTRDISNPKEQIEATPIFEAPQINKDMRQIGPSEKNPMGFFNGACRSGEIAAEGCAFCNPPAVAINIQGFGTPNFSYQCQCPSGVIYGGGGQDSPGAGGNNCS